MAHSEQSSSHSSRPSTVASSHSLGMNVMRSKTEHSRLLTNLLPHYPTISDYVRTILKTRGIERQRGVQPHTSRCVQPRHTACRRHVSYLLARSCGRQLSCLVSPSPMHPYEPMYVAICSYQSTDYAASTRGTLLLGL